MNRLANFPRPYSSSVVQVPSGVEGLVHWILFFSLSFCTRPRERFVKQRLYIPIGWGNEKNGRIRRSIWCTQNPQLVIGIPRSVRNVCKLSREKFLPAYFEVDHLHVM